MLIFGLRVLSAMLELLVIIGFGGLFVKKKVFIIDSMVMSLFMAIISNNLQSPIFKTLYLLVIVVYLIIIRKYRISESIKTVIFGMVFLIIGETIFAIVLEYMFKSDISTIPIDRRLVLLIPLRVIQLLIIINCSIGELRWGFCSGEKSKNTKKKLKKLNS